MSRFSRDASGEAWFRIGRLEVTTVMAVVLLGALGMLAWVLVPTLPLDLVYSPAAVMDGEVWRLVTWPFADTLGLWSIINLALLWYFGRDIEGAIGRRRMAWLLVGIWASLTATTALTSLTVPGPALGGLQLIEFCVLLLWIAEYPTRRFLFNIPAWVVGAVLLGLQVLTMVAARAWSSVGSLMLSLALVAMVARALGLLSAYAWIPGGRRRAPRGPVRPSAAAAPSRPEAGAVRPRAARLRASDDERMDELLGKISDGGIHSLSKAERAELEKLRQRRRR